MDFPFGVPELFGTCGNVKVKILYDEVPHRGLLTSMGGACHFLGIAKELRAKIGKEVGNTVHIRLERDLEERIVEVPEDLSIAFETSPEARIRMKNSVIPTAKNTCSGSMRPKRPETRARRVAGTIERLLVNKKEPYE